MDNWVSSSDGVTMKPEYPERTTVHGESTGKLYHLQLRVVCTFICNLQKKCTRLAVASHHDIAEILLKVALNTTNQIKSN
jgi:hypothetical protein